MIVFTPGTYSGCYALDDGHGGNYDHPVVLYGERKPDGSPGVVIDCCSSGRKTCFNLEAADHVAIDGFELVGGDYGVRSVGAGYAANKHQKGVAVLNSTGHGQRKDPFFTGQSDWFVIEHCTAYDAGKGDGHGIYLSNGSDWNIARYNETYNTASSDFQINADPLSTCRDEGMAFDDPECDAVAGSSSTGGRGASDFMLDRRQFLPPQQSARPQLHLGQKQRHPKQHLRIACTPRRQLLARDRQSEARVIEQLGCPQLCSSRRSIASRPSNSSNSTNNQIKNNVLVAVTISGSTVTGNANGQLLETDSSTVNNNTFVHNDWISGHFVSRDAAPPYAPNAIEHRHTSFAPSWFAAFPTSLGHDPLAFAPTDTAPWLNLGALLSAVPTDRDGATRHAPVDLGPFER
jgi:hypothetical protein